MSTSEPGGYVGDIYFGNPDNPTQGTHRWDGSQWVKLPSEQVALMELLVSARTRAEKLEEALKWIAHHYANQDISHIDFRVEAAQRAEAAISMTESG